MKMSRVCYGMLFYENDAFKCLKLQKTQTARASHAPGLVELFFSPNQSGVDQKHEPNCHRRAVTYIFQKIQI